MAHSISPEKLTMIMDKIRAFSTVILLQHKNPDGDALGSSLGLGHFIKHHFPHKRVLGSVTDAPDYLKFLELLPQAKSADFAQALVIISDTAVPTRIDSQYWQKGKFIIKIDHHLDSINYAHVNLNCSDRIANAEIIADLLLQSQMDIPPLSAQALYTGIVSDSNRFLYPRTNHHTMLLAAKIMQSLPNLQLIYRHLYHYPYNLFKLKIALAQYFTLASNGLGSVVLTDADLQKLHTSAQTAKQQISFFATISEVKIMLMVVEDRSEDKIKFSLRSKDKAVLAVCQHYGGGGHKFAAAGFLTNWSDLKSLRRKLAMMLL